MQGPAPSWRAVILFPLSVNRSCSEEMLTAVVHFTEHVCGHLLNTAMCLTSPDCFLQAESLSRKLEAFQAA